MSLNYSQMGFISTGNFTGYMLSVLIAGHISERIGVRKTVSLGLLLVSVSMALISGMMSFAGVLTLYFATGIGTGLVNVPIMGLVSRWFQTSMRGIAAGVMISGNGLGIVFVGFYVPYINSQFGNEGWRICWIAMGVISLIVAVLSIAFLRNTPSEKGLEPMGRAESLTPRASGSEKKASKQSRRWTLLHLAGIYTLFGSTYVVYATFIVTTVVQERGFGESAAGAFWAVVGGLSIFSGPLFGWLSDRFGRKSIMILVFTLFIISYGLVAALLPNIYLYISIALFGICVWSIPTIMSAAMGDYMGPARAAKSFGFITLFFGGGQIVGPALAGYLADSAGTFSIAFWMCAVLSFFAAAISAFLRQPISSNR